MSSRMLRALTDTYLAYDSHNIILQEYKKYNNIYRIAKSLTFIFSCSVIPPITYTDHHGPKFLLSMHCKDTIIYILTI